MVSIRDHYIDLKDTKAKFIALKEENTQLNLELNILREVQKENTKLRQMLHFAKSLDVQFLTAEVQSFDASFFYKSVRVSRGEKDGVSAGMGVVNYEGVVGIIMRTMPTVSDVLLVTDPNFSLDILIGRNRRRAILQGTGLNSMGLKYAERGSRIQVGDEIVTNGLTGAFPRGILVGRVGRVSHEQNGFSQDVDVAPAVNFSQVSDVLILLKTSAEVDTIKKIGGTSWSAQLIEQLDHR